jgi:hypothetical protein
VEVADGREPRLYLAAADGRAEHPRAEQARAHPRHGRVDDVEQGSAAAAALRLDEFEVAAGDRVDDEVVVGLEEGEVCDVRGGVALRIARVAEARARGADGRDLAAEAVAFERARPELFEQERRAGGRLPQPVFEGRERQAVALRRVVLGRRDARDGRVGVAFARLAAERERGGVRGGGVSLPDEGGQRAREEKLARGVGFDVGADARPGVGPRDFGGAEVAGREVEEGRAVRVARAADRGEVERLFGVDEVRVDGRARRDDADDLAADELLRLRGVFGLLADGDAVALAYQARSLCRAVSVISSSRAPVMASSKKSS